MSHFYMRCKGSRGEATRCGAKNSGGYAEVNGWSIGGRVRIFHEEEEDKVAFELNSGSGHGRIQRYSMTWSLERFREFHRMESFNWWLKRYSNMVWFLQENNKPEVGMLYLVGKDHYPIAFLDNGKDLKVENSVGFLNPVIAVCRSTDVWKRSVKSFEEEKGKEDTMYFSSIRKIDDLELIKMCDSSENWFSL